MSDDIKIVEELKALKKKFNEIESLTKKIETLEKEVSKLKEENKLLKKSAIKNESQISDIIKFINTLRHTIQAMNEKIAGLQSSDTSLTEGLNHIRAYLRRG